MYTTLQITQFGLCNKITRAILKQIILRFNSRKRLPIANPTRDHVTNVADCSISIHSLDSKFEYRNFEFRIERSENIFPRNVILAALCKYKKVLERLKHFLQKVRNLIKINSFKVKFSLNLEYFRALDDVFTKPYNHQMIQFSFATFLRLDSFACSTLSLVQF